MKKFNLKIRIRGAADEEEIGIILDQIKRQIFDGYYGGTDYDYSKFDWELKEREKRSRNRA